MRSRPWLFALAVALTAQISPMFITVSAQQATGMVISEFRFRGPSLGPAIDPGSVDEFIELHNAGPQAVNVNGWSVWASNNAFTVSKVLRATLPNVTIEPGCFFLLYNSSSPGGYSGAVAGDLAYLNGFADNGGVALMNSTLAIVDQVGLGTNAAAYGEGTRLGPLPSRDHSYERKPGGAAGHGIDSNNNATDFQPITPVNPQNSSSQYCIKSKVFLTHEVQGADATSAMTGQAITVRGVVTARTSNGFFLQTADSDQEDGNPNTSEGLFVAHASAAAQVGRVLHVTGTVTEFVPAADPDSAPVTQLRSVTSVTDVGGSPVPAPHVLTSVELDSNGSLDQLERFEGMRVTASLRSVSGTSLDGSFYAVLDGADRPFRAPGIEAGSPPLPCASGPCAFESFDGNPERLRVDSDGIAGPAVNLSTGAVLNDVTGPLDFSMRAYTLLPESSLTPSGGMMMSAAPAAGAGQFSIASLDLGGPAAMSHTTRLAKASLMVRAMLNLPDVIGVQGSDAAVLGELATLIDADAVASGNAAPGYAAALDGFLVKSARVAVVAADVIGATATFTDPTDGTDDPLFDQPAAMLRAVINGGSLVLPQPLTVINNHFRSLHDSARDDAAGQRARAQRQAQAEWLANFVQNRQLNDPSEAIVSLGNFNAHAFNDGYVDTMGTVMGSPAAADRVVLASPDLVSPDLLHLGGEYSSVANGNAQSLDHILATSNLGPQFMGVAYARVNADFPEALRDLADNPGRLSDRDPSVAYFSFPPDVEAPLFGVVDGVTAEATAPQGAAVTFPTPAATDNLDALVVVTCAPASGSVFPLGNSGVWCTAQDAAGNPAYVSFTVTVQDTTAPVIVVPADINDEASSPDGRVITYATSAVDAVSGSVGVSCVPASGSTFPIGTTAVECTASDAAGNAALAHFGVTVTRPIPGRMHGGGTVSNSMQRVNFTFEVGESENFVERGWLSVLSKEGNNRPRQFTAQVTEVVFSDAEAYEPGTLLTTGVDTVKFSGVGSWNGQPNYRFTATASDQGEPGVGHDTFSVIVTSPTGVIVESITGVLRGGNVQSLRH